jgi:hypothetical protein
MVYRSKPIFEFQTRWKEELVVSGFGGVFVLEHTMGVSMIFLPTKEVWQRNAPDWAKHYYAELKDELEFWCKKNNLPLRIESSAWVNFDT